MVIDLNRLNPLERDIYDKLMQYGSENEGLRILDAADLCGCSSSKISKFVKKLGFENFKQFMAFAHGDEPAEVPQSGEFQRIRCFLDEFDASSVQVFLDLVQAKSKIILLGLGPSAYCAQYMEYKMRLLLPEKLIISVPDLVATETLIDKDTLLVIFSTTGRFRSFGDLCGKIRELGGSTLMIVEEYSPDLVRMYEQESLIFLTRSSQSSQLKAHQKSRVITFIYIEEVLRQLMADQAN